MQPTTQEIREENTCSDGSKSFLEKRTHHYSSRAGNRNALTLIRSSTIRNATAVNEDRLRIVRIKRPLDAPFVARNTTDIEQPAGTIEADAMVIDAHRASNQRHSNYSPNFVICWSSPGSIREPRNKGNALIGRNHRRRSTSSHSILPGWLGCRIRTHWQWLRRHGMQPSVDCSVCKPGHNKHSQKRCNHHNKHPRERANRLNMDTRAFVFAKNTFGQPVTLLDWSVFPSSTAIIRTLRPLIPPAAENSEIA